jgi:hypothetical protein
MQQPGPAKPPHLGEHPLPRVVRLDGRQPPPLGVAQPSADVEPPVEGRGAAVLALRPQRGGDGVPAAAVGVEDFHGAGWRVGVEEGGCGGWCEEV